jgi:periplasmic divalent cation tolerance protein
MKSYLVVTTFDTEKSAKKCIKRLLQNKLAACIQSDKIMSYYVWKGKVVKDKEIRLFIKTRKKFYKKVKKLIQKNHPYEVPQIVAFEIDKGQKKYLQWVFEATKHEKNVLT